MKRRFKLWAALMLALAFGITVLAWPDLPARIPTHWNGAGEVDAWGAPATIFTEPVLMLLLAVLWPVLPGISPKRFEVDRFDDTWWFGGMAVLALLAYTQSLLLWAALGNGIDMGRALLAGIGMFVLLVGNVMGKVRRNFWLGVRTPWSLADERVWYATHRLAARTMVGSSLLAIAAAALRLPPLGGFALLLAGMLAPAAYSLVYYKRLQHGGRLG
jgi:uncharacterized membrane protein